jgi:N-acetylmuramoyl-L-alanine amidase
VRCPPLRESIRRVGLGVTLASTIAACGAGSSAAPPTRDLNATVASASAPAPATATAPPAVARGVTRTTSPAAAARAPALLGPPAIVKSYIPFGQKRKDETRAYALEHYGIDDYHLTDPHLVIWHFTETPNYQSVFNTFSDDVPDVEFHELPQVCAHFVVDTDGTIHQLVPLGIMCRHVVGLNYTSIGIENVGDSDQQVLDDPAQLHAGLMLTRWLRCRFGIPVHDVIGHNESLQSPYYRERVPAFRGQTHDDFKRGDMNIVRADVARLACRA